MSNDGKRDLLKKAGLTAAATVAALTLSAGAASAASSPENESGATAQISENSALGLAIARVLSDDPTSTPSGYFNS
ncbi:hypothetical protein [Streptomyces sp. WM6372]|uniref:hypothetical protein n=1 Tax=Streptomyces sp. WM6372 TaxID=1415555 RepID=UPI000B02261C|nr:hypothetical protein [Streptomyces sp. WM6372]